jgi:hypothetical protein
VSGNARDLGHAGEEFMARSHVEHGSPEHPAGEVVDKSS